MHVSGHTATYRNSVSANMNLIGERFFLVSLYYLVSLFGNVFNCFVLSVLAILA